MAIESPPSLFRFEMQSRRSRLRWTQRKLAEEAAYSEIYIQRLESGKQKPSRKIVLRLADAFRLEGADRTAFIALGLQEQAGPPPPITAPVPLTSFVGREDDVATLVNLLTATREHGKIRLVTLTGPAGVGKTHLALFTANTLRADFPDDVYFVDLAPMRQETYVLPTIAAALGVVAAGQRALMTALIDATRDRQQLWILDNFEQITSAAHIVAEILSHCPRLTIIVTSRILLQMRGEQQFPLAPLPIPGSQQQEITTEAVTLLTDRTTRLLTLTGQTATAQTRLACPWHVKYEAQQAPPMELAGPC